MNGAVLAVGDELLLGDIVNSNAAWLGEQLAAVGVQVVASATTCSASRAPCGAASRTPTSSY